MKQLNRVVAMAVIAASALGLSACTSTNAYHGQDQLNATSEGVGVGAATGAIIAGIATGGPGAVVGAAIGGGAVGGGVGYSLDKDETAIREKLRSAGVSVVEVGYSNDVVLLMPSDVHFAFGSAEVSPRFKASLDAVAEVMKEYQYTVAYVPGNADSIGSPKYNMNLSLARAQNVADYIAAQGVPGNRLVPEGYGSMKPVASNDTAKGRAMNRRVQIILTAPPIPLKK